MGQGESAVPSGAGGPQANNSGGGISISLTSESGLRPSITDLEKLFDTDDSESSDADLVTAPSPPSKVSEDVKPPGSKGSSLASSIVHGGRWLQYMALPPVWMVISLGFTFLPLSWSHVA